jgi:hypothetical protein
MEWWQIVVPLGGGAVAAEVLRLAVSRLRRSTLVLRTRQEII